MASTYQQLILQGEEIREKGSPKTALPIFDQALAKAENSIEKTEALRHKGLCYEHLGELDYATTLYEQAGKTAVENNNFAGAARAMRHQASCARKQKNYTRAIELASDARVLMKKEKPVPTDLCWVTHGVIQAMLESNQPRLTTLKWCLIELIEQINMLCRETNEIRRRVWFTGWLMDTARTLGIIGQPLQWLAYWISKRAELKLRQDQIKAGHT